MDTERPSGNSFTVRHAGIPDLRAARALMTSVIERDFGYGYVPEWHWDIGNLQETYIETARQTLFVAVDDATGELLGTSGIRAGGHKTPPHPLSVTQGRDPEKTAQLVRVYVAAEHRRRGIGKALAERAAGWARNEAGYTTVQLHTQTRVSGAEPFWHAMPTTMICDRRSEGTGSDTVYFEITIPESDSRSEFRVDSDTMEKIDFEGWVQRWERQQSGHVADWEGRLNAMMDALELLMPEQFSMLDLCCGPGTISRRVLARFPGARSTALDLDPVLLMLGRGSLGDFEGRLRWVEGDLTTSDWPQFIPERNLDAVLSTTALHWLPGEHLFRTYKALGELVRPGGVLLNGDHMAYPPHMPAFKKIADTMRERRRDTAFSQPGSEDYDQWWDALKREPSTEELFRERDRRFGWKTTAPKPIYDLHEAALRDAGFREVGVIWQNFNNRVLMAIR